MPGWLSLGTGGHAHRPPVTSPIYSDDHWKTWNRGETAVPDTPEFVFPNKTLAAQLPDGRVMLNVRSESKAHRRLITYSRDGGASRRLRAWSVRTRRTARSSLSLRVSDAGKFDIDWLTAKYFDSKLADAIARFSGRAASLRSIPPQTDKIE